MNCFETWTDPVAWTDSIVIDRVGSPEKFFFFFLFFENPSGLLIIGEAQQAAARWSRSQNNHSPMLDNYIDATDMNGRERGKYQLNL